MIIIGAGLLCVVLLYATANAVGQLDSLGIKLVAAAAFFVAAVQAIRYRFLYEDPFVKTVVTFFAFWIASALVVIPLLSWGMEGKTSWWAYMPYAALISATGNNVVLLVGAVRAHVKFSKYRFYRIERREKIRIWLLYRSIIAGELLAILLLPIGQHAIGNNPAAWFTLAISPALLMGFYVAEFGSTKKKGAPAQVSTMQGNMG